MAVVCGGQDDGAVTSDADTLLLGATDWVLGLTRRLAACFKDSRNRLHRAHARSPAHAARRRLSTEPVEPAHALC